MTSPRNTSPGPPLARELPRIWRITKGSLFHKIVIILPLALLLMLRGTYLVSAGVEKIRHRVLDHAEQAHPVPDQGTEAADTLVRSVVSSFNEMSGKTLWLCALVLFIVALGAPRWSMVRSSILSKMDDLGPRLVARSAGSAADWSPPCRRC